MRNSGSTLHLVKPLGFELTRAIPAGVNKSPPSRCSGPGKTVLRPRARVHRQPKPAVRAPGAGTPARRRCPGRAESHGLPAAVLARVAPGRQLANAGTTGNRSLKSANTMALVMCEDCATKQLS